MKQHTLEELKQIEALREIERERTNLAIRLNICPVCGSNIIDDLIEKHEERGFWIFSHTTTKWDVRRVCSGDAKHYERKWMKTNDWGW